LSRAFGKLEGWDFSRVRDGGDPVPWNYVDVVQQYLKPTDRVLDIGTGGGEIFLSLVPYFGEGVGIDMDPAMIETAQRSQSTLSIDNISKKEWKPTIYSSIQGNLMLSYPGMCGCIQVKFCVFSIKAPFHHASCRASQFT
jgi:SAM-dependent methyltransferase